MNTKKQGWFKATRGTLPMTVIKQNPIAYALAAVIAHRARWNKDATNILSMEQGEALLGDFENYGMTEQQYRTAKRQLEKWGLATFTATSRGTVAKLTNSDLFDFYPNETNGQANTLANGQANTLKSEKVTDGQPGLNAYYGVTCGDKKDDANGQKSDELTDKLTPSLTDGLTTNQEQITKNEDLLASARPPVGGKASKETRQAALEMLKQARESM